ncbi:putative porin [Thalassotalea agarivorans]|nr:putative porin [Thalassotalea agarivorans]
MKKILLALICLSAALPVYAEQYRTIANTSLGKEEIKPSFGSNAKADFFNFNAIYYFDDKLALGPLDEFGYLNRISNVYGSANHLQNDSFTLIDYHVGGDWHLGDFIVGAEIRGIDISNRNDFQDDNKILKGKLGYFIDENLLFNLTYNYDDETKDSMVDIGVNYQVILPGYDYVGFGYKTNDELDVHSVDVQYFSNINESQYIRLYAEYNYWVDAENDSWSVGANYNISQNTSFYATLDVSGDSYSVGAKHYFNRSWALAGEYRELDADIADVSQYTLTVSMQF